MAVKQEDCLSAVCLLVDRCVGFNEEVELNNNSSHVTASKHMEEIRTGGWVGLFLSMLARSMQHWEEADNVQLDQRKSIKASLYLHAHMSVTAFVLANLVVSD